MRRSPRYVHDGPFIPRAGRAAPRGALVRVGAVVFVSRSAVGVLHTSHSRGCMSFWTAAARFANELGGTAPGLVDTPGLR